MQSTHLIKYNEPRTYDVYAYEGPDPKNKIRIQLHLNPGINKVPTDLWRKFVSDDEELKGHPGTIRRIESGEIEIVSVLGAGKEQGYYLSDFTFKQAIDAIDGVYDDDTLSEWLKAENALEKPRNGVLRKLESQIERVKAAVKSDDDSDNLAY